MRQILIVEDEQGRITCQIPDGLPIVQILGMLECAKVLVAHGMKTEHKSPIVPADVSLLNRLNGNGH